MKHSSYSLLIILSACVLSACAQTKTTTGIKPATSYARVIEANRYRTLPGAPGMEPTDEYRLLIVWKSKQKPDEFFWRSTGNWMPCDVAQAHKNTSARAGERWYTTEAISIDNVKTGDTLELLPVAGGKFPIPQQIPASSVNTIYLKTKKTSWLSLPVKNIKRHDEVMQ